jgi:hypothetical protein
MTKSSTQPKFRQGDILFVPVSRLPKGKPKKRATGLIAAGEVTGHAHRLAPEDLETSEVLEIGDGLFVRISKDGFAIDGSPGATIVHDEHGPITLAPGVYEVRQQRERDLFSEVVRPVMD